MSGYGEFASYYDALTGNVDYAARAGYLLELFRRFGREPTLLLDAACGTGSFSLAFAKKGIEVIGIDASEQMLSAAQARALEQGESILFLKQNMQEIDLYGTVDGAVCCLDSVNHLLTARDVSRFFSRVSLFLEPGCLFLFDVNTLYKHDTVLGGNTFVYDTDEVYCVWQNESGKDHTVTISLDFFERNGETYIRRCERFRERAYSEETLCSLLEKAGLETLAVYGEQSFLPPKAQEERVVFVTKKR